MLVKLLYLQSHILQILETRVEITSFKIKILRKTSINPSYCPLYGAVHKARKLTHGKSMFPH